MADSCCELASERPVGPAERVAQESTSARSPAVVVHLAVF